MGSEGVAKKNWETISEKTEDKLLKWQWLLPHISFRVLILNSLTASQLWHRLTCLDLPPGLQIHREVSLNLRPFLNVKRCPNADSLHLLLREPLINGARFDVSSEMTLGLTAALTRSGTVTLQQLDAVGQTPRPWVLCWDCSQYEWVRRSWFCGPRSSQGKRKPSERLF